MGKPGKFDFDERSAEFRMVLAIAKALREEFGADIDAHPGGDGSEAGAINRAYRAAARVVLSGAVPPDEMSDFLTWMLTQAARWRLAELAVVGDIAEELLDLEPGLGDRWMAYLALAPEAVISDLGSAPKGSS